MAMQKSSISNESSSPNKRTAAIIARALQDDAYREALLVNPKAAIQQAFGKELPLGLDVRVVEESPTVVYLVLPARPVVALSDGDLDAVAGGFAAPKQAPPGRSSGCYALDEWLTTVLM